MSQSLILIGARTDYEDLELNDLKAKKGTEFLILNIADASFGIFQIVVLIFYFKSWIRLSKLKMMDIFTNLTFASLAFAVIIRFIGSLIRCVINFNLQLSTDLSWYDNHKYFYQELPATFYIASVFIKSLALSFNLTRWLLV